ncbi:hypothetical protein PsorP6_004217 [Peronosclerospora sorghi]|uniref:Uncharacterized protein n=1 Tax=Peronosclerospora sorghi TaxID=230839 RepID=A0ACC0VR15_9STRA|nr:hypothetical protein PsorP6_004217 [Peronosclerospora sorghi]
MNLKSSGTGATRFAQEVEAQVIQQKFEALVVVLGAVEDEKVLTAGSECFKWLVMFTVDDLAAYTTATGANGINTTLSVSAKLVLHAVSDASATCVCRLINQILLKLGPILPTPTVQKILGSLCSRLAATKLPSLVQSLCMVFARLVPSHGPDLLNVLEQMPPLPSQVGQF